MGKAYDTIDPRIAAWIERQHMFFVATAPLAGNGRVNCSPKGLDTLRILSPERIAWLDVGGSGIETVAHLKENGRIVLMFCAFEDAPRIVRVHGRGTVIERGHAQFAELLALFPAPPVCRTLIDVRIDRVSESCGWGVPLYQYQHQRDDIARAVRNKTPEQLRMQAVRQNRQSLDGLPGLDLATLNDDQ